MSCQLQLLINRLPLPRSLLEIVKSFCLYDMKSGQMILLTKHRKRKIHEMITMHCITNKDIVMENGEPNPYVANFIYWIVDNETVFNNALIDDDEYFINNTTMHIQSCMCPICGNYQLSSVVPMDAMCQKIVCSCPLDWYDYAGFNAGDDIDSGDDIDDMDYVYFDDSE